MEERLQAFYQALGEYYKTCDYQGMEEFLQRKLRENMSACAACYNPLTVSVYNEMGTMYRCMGAHEKSKASFQAAVDTIQMHIGKETLEYATALNNLAGTCRLAGEHEEAIRLFQEALAVYEKLGEGETDNYFYTAALNNLGLVYLETKDLPAAEEIFSRVLPVMEQLQGTQGQMEPELAVTWCNIATGRFFGGDYEGAETAIARALDWYERSPESRRGHLGAVYNLQGDLMKALGRRAEAAHAYEQSMHWTEHFFGQNPEYQTARAKLERLSDPEGR